MKLKYILSGLMAVILGLTSCEDPDKLIRTENDLSDQLVVKAVFLEDSSTELSSTISKEDGTVMFDVPYYISDKAPIQADLTKMKLMATLPTGARFVPALSGVFNLKEGISSTLLYEDGRRESYRFFANYVKSNKAFLTKVELTKTRAIVKVLQPEDGKPGEIQILKETDALVPSDLADADIELSPWATVETEEDGIYNPETGRIDLSSMPNVTVVAQNGKDKNEYVTKFIYPEMVEYGEIGFVKSLFGFQTYKDETHGFEVDANRTMAVVGSYLILNNDKNFSNMLVFDRYSGELSRDIHVNCDGIPAGRMIRAISTDDAGHLVAMTYTSIQRYNDNYPESDPEILVYVWENGINQTPTEVMNIDINDPACGGVHFIGTTLKVRGDMTKGSAVVATQSPWTPRPIFFPFKDGKLLKDKIVVEWRHHDGRVGQYGGSTKIIPLTSEPTINEETGKYTYEYIADAGAGAKVLDYVPSGVNKGWAFDTDVAWAHSYTSEHNAWIIASDYIEFNGVKMVGVLNMAGSVGFASKFYVSDITRLGPAALKTNVIFSSQGGKDGTGNGLDVPGSGFKVTGYTSSDTFVPGREVLARNDVSNGDIVFAKSEDGNTLHIYMLSTNNGLIAYEITKYKL